MMISTLLYPALGALVALCLLPGTLACSCRAQQPKLLQDLFCSSEYVLEVVATSSEIINENDSGLGFNPFGERRYTVNTTAVYKSSPQYDALLNKNYIYTSADGGLCGVYLEVGARYVIFGNLVNGRLDLFLCGFRGVKSERLTDEQICGLEYAYQQNCDQCQIKYWWMMNPYGQQVADSQSCVSNHGRSFRCFNDHAICKAQSSLYRNVCEWADGGSNKFQECLNQTQEAENLGPNVIVDAIRPN